MKHFLVLICENKVIAFATNVSSFHKEVKKVSAISNKIRGYSAFNDYFKKNNIMDLAGNDGKIYVLQKII